MLSRFAYVKFDPQSAAEQNALRTQFSTLEALLVAGDPAVVVPALNDQTAILNASLPALPYREKAIDAMDVATEAARTGDLEEGLNALELAYYWAGKFIRLAAISRAAPVPDPVPVPETPST